MEHDRNARIPTRVRLALVAAAPEGMRMLWAHRLGDAGHEMAVGFVEALNSPDIEVYADQAETDPEEIVVRARGTTAAGIGWRDMNILMLDPWWSDRAASSQALADHIVASWDGLRRLAAMPEPVCPVTIVTDIRPHGDNLSIVTVEGREVVANRLETGGFRWSPGEMVVYIPEDAIIPDDVLRERHYWDETKDRGTLGGKRKNRVQMRLMAGHESRGLLFKTIEHGGLRAVVNGDAVSAVGIGDDVAFLFGITMHDKA